MYNKPLNSAASVGRFYPLGTVLSPSVWISWHIGPCYFFQPSLLLIPPWTKTAHPFCHLKITSKPFSHVPALVIRAEAASSWSELCPVLSGFSPETADDIPRPLSWAGPGVFRGQIGLERAWKPLSFLQRVSLLGPCPSPFPRSPPGATLIQESIAKYRYCRPWSAFRKTIFCHLVFPSLVFQPWFF